MTMEQRMHALLCAYALGEGLEPLLEGRKGAKRNGTARIETGMGLAQGEVS